MGEGVSLCLPRNGFLVDHLLGVSVPFPREHGFYTDSSDARALKVHDAEDEVNVDDGVVDANDAYIVRPEKFQFME